MWEIILRYFQQPLTIKFTTAVVIVALVWLAAKIIRNNIGRHVPESKNRYRIRKVITLVAYAITFLAVAFIFSDKMKNLTVAIGIAGAGIAFALQEVIASFAGWLAIMFADFYKTGDRVQLGGIKGDVIDIGILRTTIMEMGEWVTGDQYNGRIVRVANSGQATAGADPVEATRLAAERGVRIYTVGIGTPAGETLKVDGWSMRVRLDEDAMKAIAAGTQGEYFAATNAADLKKIYEALSSRLLFERRETEIGALFAAAAALLLALGALASQWWFNRIL